MESRDRKSAKDYYNDVLLKNLLNAVFEKYKGYNGVRGIIKFKVDSKEEATRLQEFFGARLKRMIRVGMVVEVPMKLFAEDIAQGYNLDIPELYELLYEEVLLTKAEQKLLKEQDWHLVFEQAKINFSEYTNSSETIQFLESKTFNWYQRLYDGKAPGYRVVQHAIRTGSNPAELIFCCLKALWYLFVKYEEMLEIKGIHVTWIRLPIFAEFITGNDAHAFDKNFATGRLLEHALEDMYRLRLNSGEIIANAELLVPDFLRRRNIYQHSGIRLDDVSSRVDVFIIDNYYGKTVRTFNLNELNNRQNWLNHADLYVFENPSIFSYLVDETLHFLETKQIKLEQIPEHFPILVCTSGQAHDAAKIFIDQHIKVNPNCKVYYSGDFDTPGLQMLETLQRLGNIQVLRMDAETYQNKVHLRNLSLHEQDIRTLKATKGDLPKAMVKARKKVYQEAITKELGEDWIQLIEQIFSDQ
ncbi:TIGR02679 domain-containing protein [Paenibacillus sp. PK4536]|uniref:TIGR02679 domain-containing protein n=1 Tax=Paenibacillus sp. PK4536 TaxID=3024576 RepID=UPI002359EFC5|nr:DUF2399 domain-containing protein [Paenibacillus sp. PK4536]WIM40340.1 TIGR02679 domain-containing protein [Paenibacillus sp. PK4536]